MTDHKRTGHIVIGAPGAFTLLAFDVIKLIARAVGDREVALIDRSDLIDLETASERVYLAQYPGEAAIDAIATGRLCPVVIIEDPLLGAAYLRSAQGTSYPQALRSLSAACVAHLVLAASPGLERICHRDDIRLADMVRHLQNVLGIPVDAAGLTAIQRTLCPELANDGTVGEALLFRMRGTGFKGDRTVVDEETRAVIDRLVRPLTDLIEGKPLRPIVWPTNVFLSGDRPDHPTDTVIQLTGPARVIVYGPYFHLPPAEYQVEIILAFSGRIEDIPFVIEVRGSSCLARIKIKSRATGGYRGTFKVHHRNPVDAIEIHLRNERGAIEGEVALVEMRFLPLRPYFKSMP